MGIHSHTLTGKFFEVIYNINWMLNLGYNLSLAAGEILISGLLT